MKTENLPAMDYIIIWPIKKQQLYPTYVLQICVPGQEGILTINSNISGAYHTQKNCFQGSHGHRDLP